MRLTEKQKSHIRAAAAQTFGECARVRLFGSRLDDQARGGDIDLLVECPEPVENAGLAAARMAAKIQIALGDRKIDVLYTWPGHARSPVHRVALGGHGPVSTVRERERLRFLATLEIVRRELAVLAYSRDKLLRTPLDEAWVKSLDTDMQGAEAVEAFVSRFGRTQHTLGDKLIPRALGVLLEKRGSLLDNLNRAERLGWIEDTEAWVAARELRNRLIHEYQMDLRQFATDLGAAIRAVDLLRSGYGKLLQLARERLGVPEDRLQDYLRLNGTLPGHDQDPQAGGGSGDD